MLILWGGWIGPRGSLGSYGSCRLLNHEGVQYFIFCRFSRRNAFRWCQSQTLSAFSAVVFDTEMLLTFGSAKNAFAWWNMMTDVKELLQLLSRFKNKKSCRKLYDITTYKSCCGFADNCLPWYHDSVCFFWKISPLCRQTSGIYHDLQQGHRSPTQ